MIVFDLKCDTDHVFEAWFRSSGDFERQQSQGYVTCPHCGSTEVKKALSAPNVGRKSNQVSAQKTARTDTTVASGPTPNAGMAPPTHAPQHLRQMVRAVKAHIEANCDNVGTQFAEEARKIHYGDSEPRGIYGQSTREEAKALHEEGVDFFGLPDIADTDA